MGHRSGLAVRAVGLWLVVAAVMGTANAGGWNREEQGAKATALGQAFVAQTDDPSAVYYNPAALAFAPDRAVSLGFALNESLEAAFSGAASFPGAGADGKRLVDPEPLPHLYWVEPVAGRWSIGMSLQQSMGFETAWERADGWSGRFIARRARLRSWDLAAVAALRVGSTWGLAAGLTVRRSDLAWERSEAIFDPIGQQDVEVGLSSLRSSRGLGVGPVLALNHRPPGRWSWGLRWRGAIATDLDGAASYVQRTTGDPALDALAAATLPLGGSVPWMTRVRFPQRFTCGVAYAITPTVRLEVDLDHSGWESLNTAIVTFSGQVVPDRSLTTGWRDRTAKRAGLRWNGLGNGEWRAGLFVDPTPQPAEDVGPFFVGADRLGASIGYGTRVRRLQTDVAVVWEEHEKRTTAHGFAGVHRTRRLGAVVSFGW